MAVVLDPARGRFDELDVVLMAVLGRRGGSALDNARRFDREREIALELQHGLLPRLRRDRPLRSLRAGRS
jgi:hypothetical protein